MGGNPAERQSEGCGAGTQRTLGEGDEDQFRFRGRRDPLLSDFRERSITEVFNRERPRGNPAGSRTMSIVAARCGQTSEGFGIRFERSGEDHWSATWAFSLKETVARREGYDRSEIRGTI